jgi:hypothetical protein
VDDSASLNEDGSITLTLLANDSDADGDALTLTLQCQPAHGTLLRNAVGQYIYTPVANWSGEDRFTYALFDGKAWSNLATVRLLVSAVADAPRLVLTDIAASPHELFRTGWESVANQNTSSSLLQQRTLEGWTLVTSLDNSACANNGFEIWSSGDKMADASNNLRTVNAASNNGSSGNNWMELNNASGNMPQTLGVERSLSTLAGARYTLSLDAAGRMGYSADYTRIGIYVDGQRIGGWDGTSGSAALNWQTLSFQFVGKGGQQTIRIAAEASKLDPNGRGMMIDNIALNEALGANTGLEDQAIRLSNISAALSDTDGSEILSVSLEALPIGATLSDGTRSFTARSGNSTADISGWNMACLSLLPPADFNGTLNLRVVATASEKVGGSRSRTSASLVVTVLAVNDAPRVLNASYQLLKDGTVRIDFSALIRDVDGDALSLSFTRPAHGTLTRNSDGSYTYRPNRNYIGSDAFNYTISDGQLASSGAISLSVGQASVATAVVGAAPLQDSCASIVLRSNYSLAANSGSANANANPQGSSSQFVDWSSNAVPISTLGNLAWVRDFLGATQDQRSLAERTGLSVRASL